MTKGYYSLIQFCPDFSRAEVVNVGVVLFRPEPLFCGARVEVDVRRIRQLARPVGADVSVVEQAAHELAYRAEHANFRTVEDLEQFAVTRGNTMLVTQPRPLRTEEPEALLNSLCDELVAAPREIVIARPPERELVVLREAFTSLHEAAPDRAWIGGRYHVRGMAVTVVADFAYQNGKLNIVQATAVPKRNLRGKAFELNTVGELVESRLEESKATGGQLTVVAIRDETRLESEREFGAMLAALPHVDFVASDAVAEFARRVEAEVIGHSD